MASKTPPLKRSTQSPAPVCFWCGIRIDADSPYRGEDPSLPAGSGVVVCTPACPERPDGMRIYTHPDWRTNK